MSPKSACALALSAVLLIAFPLAAEAADASGGQDYVSQLDANGSGLYDHMTDRFEEMYDDPEDTAVFSYTLAYQPAFATQDAAYEYASSFVHDTLAAYYLTNPYPIWLWDYPVTGATVNSVIEPATGEDGTVTYVLISVSFQLSVPDEFADDVAGAIQALSDAVGTYEGDTVGIVTSINDLLRGVTVTDDSDGEISNPYDALVTGSSSDAGIAAAFTLLCQANGVTAITAMGQVESDSDEGYSTGCWNLVLMDDGWYAVDCTLNSSDANNCLLVGVSDAVTVGNLNERFGGNRTSGIEMADEVSLSVPHIVYSGYEWPDETSFIDQYGAYIVLLIMMVIIVAVLVHAIRSGNVR